MPPRGLRLFVRPIEAEDHPALEAFFARQTEGLTPTSEGLTPEVPPAGNPAWGLLGKLLGDVVAVVALQITEDALRVEDVTVARELRRKWIGRVMMREVEQLAVKMDRRRIVVEHAGDAQEFFRRVGFQSEGERWVRVVP
jgi:ribosomal protein S18 acetylase RimI-like enzyme